MNGLGNLTKEEPELKDMEPILFQEKMILFQEERLLPEKKRIGQRTIRKTVAQERYQTQEKPELTNEYRILVTLRKEKRNVGQYIDTF